jgi:hypothetical protein
VREDGRVVGGEGWQEKGYNREEWKRLLRTARNRRILHMPTEWMNCQATSCTSSVLVEYSDTSSVFISMACYYKICNSCFLTTSITYLNHGNISEHIQGDQKVTVHLMITVQKTHKNIYGHRRIQLQCGLCHTEHSLREHSSACQ